MEIVMMSVMQKGDFCDVYLSIRDLGSMKKCQISTHVPTRVAWSPKTCALLMPQTCIQRTEFKSEMHLKTSSYKKCAYSLNTGDAKLIQANPALL